MNPHLTIPLKIRPSNIGPKNREGISSIIGWLVPDLVGIFGSYDPHVPIFPKNSGCVGGHTKMVYTYLDFAHPPPPPCPIDQKPWPSKHRFRSFWGANQPDRARRNTTCPSTRLKSRRTDLFVYLVHRSPFRTSEAHKYSLRYDYFTVDV
jgi:hypothetical protein